MKASSLIHASLRCWRELAGKMMPKIMKVRMNPVSTRRNGLERRLKTDVRNALRIMKDICVWTHKNHKLVILLNRRKCCCFSGAACQRRSVTVYYASMLRDVSLHVRFISFVRPDKTHIYYALWFYRS